MPGELQLAWEERDFFQRDRGYQGQNSCSNDSGERIWNLSHSLWTRSFIQQAGTKGERRKKGKRVKKTASFGVPGRYQGICMCP